MSRSVPNVLSGRPDQTPQVRSVRYAVKEGRSGSDTTGPGSGATGGPVCSAGTWVAPGAGTWVTPGGSSEPLITAQLGSRQAADPMRAVVDLDLAGPFLHPHRLAGQAAAGHDPAAPPAHVP